MTIRTVAVGDVVDEVVFTVEEGKIREFARATGAQDVVHTDAAAAAAAGYPAPLATGTHVVVSGHHRDQLAMVTKLGLAIDRVVVGSSRWCYHRPLVAGDRLSGARRLVDDEQIGGRTGGPTMRRLTLTTTFLDAAGLPAVEWHEVVLERGPAR